MPPKPSRRSSIACGISSSRSTPRCTLRARAPSRKVRRVVPEKGPIPAHLLGNLWEQDWANIYPLVAPREHGSRLLATERLKAKKIDASRMVRIGERFFTSLGFDPLPKTFWERSLFVKPRDRDVVCHASAWDMDNVDDLRIKMCIDVNEEDFTTIHHELGHNFYQRAYNQLPMMFRDSANDGFHEAVGDTLALSVTPEYLVKIGLARQGAVSVRRHQLLLRRGARTARVPAVRTAGRPVAMAGFRRDDPAGRLQQAWWELKLNYQGVAPSSPRGEEFFDPGAKYHVPANTPYSRYFLAGFSSSSSIARWRRRPAARRRCIAARFTAARKPERS